MDGQSMCHGWLTTKSWWTSLLQLVNMCCMLLARLMSISLACNEWNGSIFQSIDGSIHSFIDRWIDQRINGPIDQLIDRPNNSLINRWNDWLLHRLIDPSIGRSYDNVVQVSLSFVAGVLVVASATVAYSWLQFQTWVKKVNDVAITKWKQNLLIQRKKFWNI